jgi:hypothetical protein
LPVRFSTTTVFTSGHSFKASSVVCLSGTMRPPRYPPSAVITMSLLQSWMRFLSDSAEKPPNTTLWIAPMRAQASIAMGSSGTMGK